MKRDAGINGEGQRQNHKQPVGRIKKSGLKAAQIGLAAKKPGIPQSQMAFF